MKIGGRYKLIGKKRHAVIDMPYDQAIQTFEDMLTDETTSSRLVASVDNKTDIFKIEYRMSQNKNDVYENYCMLAELSETADGGTRIEYAFVYDRLISWYTRFLSFVCLLVPLAAALMVYFRFELRKPAHLFIYVPLLLISAFGVFSLFGYKEKKETVKPMVKEFERLLIASFDGE